MTSTRSLSGPARGRGKPRLAGALLALAASVAACGGGSDIGPPPILPQVCTAIRSPEVQKGTHIAVGQTGTYNTTPPSSGVHYPAPARVGGYTEPIRNEVQVHNLEHGHVMIQYRGLTNDQIDELEELIRKDPTMVLLAPYPDMDQALAFTSWGKIQTCSAWEEGVQAAATYFIKKNRDHAPESIQ